MIGYDTTDSGHRPAERGTTMETTTAPREVALSAMPGMNGEMQRVTIGALSVWFSCETPIAFHYLGGDRIVRENEWGTTTGRHMGAIDGGTPKARAERLPAEQFLTALSAATGSVLA